MILKYIFQIQNNDTTPNDMFSGIKYIFVLFLSNDNYYQIDKFIDFIETIYFIEVIDQFIIICCYY